MSKKVYLAGSCASEQRTIMKALADDIRNSKLDIDLYCPFELKIENAWDYSQEEWAQKVFDADLKALNEADIVIVISQGRMSSAGTNWEQGYAFAQGKKVFVFQITDEPTSLMSFCGCTLFYNCPASITNMVDLSFHIYEIIHDIILDEFEHWPPIRAKCKTVLT